MNLTKLLLISSFLPFLSCNDDKNGMLPFDNDIVTTADKSYVIEATSPQSLEFVVKDPIDCNIVSDEDWASVTTSKEDRSTKVTVTFTDNTSEESRLDTLRISSSSVIRSLLIPIKQFGTNGGSMIGLEKNFDELQSDEVNVYTMNVLSNSKWTLSTKHAWLVFHQSKGEKGLTTIKFHAIANLGDAREDVVTITNEDGDSNSFTIKQQASKFVKGNVRVGDPNVSFDMSKLDSNFPQMKEWMSAGVTGGIPKFNEANIKKSITSSNSDAINAAIQEVASQGGGILLLKDGDYDIDKVVNMVSKVTVRGESKDGVILRINKELVGDAIKFRKTIFCGIENLTIRGMWLNEDGENVPKFADNGDLIRNQQLPTEGVSIHFDTYSSDAASTIVNNCWVDGVNIINSSTQPIVDEGHYETFRDVVIDGAFNKDGGCQGYFFLDGDHALVTGCHVSRLRHISMQGANVQYNVFYDNDLNQEISFHCNDGGNNLIENNRITTPVYMTSDYSPIMGPWSSQHSHSKLPNYLLHNDCFCPNNGDARPYNDNKLYIGPFRCLSGATFEQHVNNFVAVPNTDRPWEYIPTVIFDNKGTGIFDTAGKNGESFYNARKEEGNFSVVIKNSPKSGTLYPINL